MISLLELLCCSLCKIKYTNLFNCNGQLVCNNCTNQKLRTKNRICTICSKKHNLTANYKLLYLERLLKKIECSGRWYKTFDNNMFDSNKYDNNMFDSNKYDNNMFDNNKYDSNKYDSNKYDSNKYDSNKYDSNKFDNNKYDNNKFETDQNDT